MDIGGTVIGANRQLPVNETAPQPALSGERSRPVHFCLGISVFRDYRPDSLLAARAARGKRRSNGGAAL